MDSLALANLSPTSTGPVSSRFVAKIFLTNPFPRSTHLLIRQLFSYFFFQIMFLQTPPSPRDLYRTEETLGSELCMLDPTSQNQQMDLDTNPPLDCTEILFAQEV